MNKICRAFYLLGIFLFCRGLSALTWNVARPYSRDDREITMPSFSRLRDNLVFMEGDKIEIFFFPRKRPARVEWKLSCSMVKASFMEGIGETCLDRSVRVVVPAGELSPGFYDLRVRAYISDEIWEEGSSTFGYRVEEMGITESMQPDFKKFWEDSMSILNEEKLDPKEEFICEMDDEEISLHNIQKASKPEDYDPEGKKAGRIKVHKINFNAAGKRFYGWLTVPEGDGPFPGLLILPGAGISRQPVPAEQARHGFVSLALQVHPGLDVDMEKYPKIPRYRMYHREGYPEDMRDEYFHDVFLGCVQAVNFLKAREDVDPSKIVVAGQSQGGMLSIITAALSPDVRAVVSSLTAFAYWPFREHIAEINSKNLSCLPVGKLPPFFRDNKRQLYLSYYDTMNFAKHVKAPVIILACLCDRVSFIPTVFATYKSLPNPASRIYFSPNTNHDYVIAFEKLAWRWLEEILR